MNTEKETQPKSNYLELGEIPNFENRLGKHQRIKVLEESGLEIPETLILGFNSENEKERFHNWCQKCKSNNLDFLIRTDNAEGNTTRYMPSIRDANSDIDSLWQKSQELLTAFPKGLIIIQGLRFNIINLDILSANIQFERTDTYGNSVRSKIEATPDIAPLINRLQLKPAFIIPDSPRDNESEGFKVENTENLWAMILYRVGREELRKVHKNLPNIENLPDDYKESFKEVIETGKETLRNNPEKYPAPGYWYNEVLKNDLSQLYLPEKLAILMLNERTRIIKKANDLQNPLSDFESSILKMSFILDPESRTISPIYWDIIEEVKRKNF